MTDNQTPARRMRHGQRPEHELYWPETGQPRRWAALITSAGHGVLQEYGSKFEHAQPGQEMLEVMEILPSAAHKRPLDENDFHDIWEKLGGKDAFMKTFGYLQFGFAVMDEAIRKLSPDIANKATEEGEQLHHAAIAAAEEWANAEWAHAKNLYSGGAGAAERCNKAEIACRTAINELAANRASSQVANKAADEPRIEVTAIYGDMPPVWRTLPATTGASTEQVVDRVRADVGPADFGVTQENEQAARNFANFLLSQARPASTVLTDERIIDLMEPELLKGDGGYLADIFPEYVIAAGRAIEREVAAQAGQVAVPIYQIQYVDEKGSSIWHDSTEEAYHTFVLARRRIVYAAPSPVKESK